MSMRSLFDQFANGFGNMVSDVREKLVEEGWFGRTTSPHDGAQQNMSTTLGWTQAVDVNTSIDLQAEVKIEAPSNPLTWDEFCSRMQRGHDYGRGHERTHEIDHDRHHAIGHSPDRGMHF